MPHDVPFKFRRALAVVLAALLLQPVALGLEAGVATVDITPDTKNHHVPLGGYGERQNAAALGVHDSTLAKALLLREGSRKFALVSVDLQGVPRSLRDAVVARVADAGISSDNLLLAASHSHASVEMNAMNDRNVFQNKAIGIYDEYLLTFTADRIAESILKANEDIEAVRVGTGSTTIEGMNRNRRGNDLTDTEMTVMRIDKADGTPKVVFVNYAAHPTFMNEKTMHVSAGWPGYLQREIEAFIGDGVVCMYSNGAEGDVAPRGGHGASEFARAEDYGRRLAVQAIALAKDIETSSSTRFRYSMSTLKPPPRTPPKALLDAAGPEYGLTPENIGGLIDALVPETSYLSTLQLGDFLAVSIPGEMTSVLGLEIKEVLSKAGAKHPIIVGLGNEWISYILSQEEYHGGGYEPGVSFYGELLGPTVVEQAIEAGENLLKTR